MTSLEDDYKTALKTRFAKHYKINNDTNCWEWTGTKHKFGYGQITINKQTKTAHRVSWELFRGPIPTGMWILHAPVICHNPSCANPDHLRLGTCKENEADKKLDNTDKHDKKLTLEQREIIRTSHKHTDDLVEEFGVSRSIICKIRRGMERPKLPRRGITVLPPVHHGSKNATSKLTEEQVLDIRSRTNPIQTSLAKEFGVSQAIISKILLRKAWTHI